jgi:transcription antitermination factor NusG
VQQRVSFKEGPFGGLFAKIMSIDPRGRIRLLLDLFGRETKIEVDADEIAAA